MLHYVCMCSRTVHVPPPYQSPSFLGLVALSYLILMYRYLTEIAKVDIYWTGSRLTQLSPIIPPVGKNISRQAVVPWRYHFNTGTSPSLDVRC
jgi:hypothetical protein